jgi:hypothetical protein
MKRFFYLCLALLMLADSARAFENEPEEGLTWMGIFGMNVSKLMNHEYNAKVGATLGIKADYMLPSAHGAYVTAGLDWTMKGSRITRSVPVGTLALEAIDKYPLHYIELPIRAGFRYNINESFGLYAEFGPYFAVGVGGYHTRSIDGDGADVRKAEDDFTFRAFSSTDDIVRQTFQRWDAGLSLRLGAEYNDHYNLMIGFDWGFPDIYRDSLRDKYFEAHQTRLPKVYNFNFSITTGYRF